jgi:hypothetical protein
MRSTAAWLRRAAPRTRASWGYTIAHLSRRIRLRTAFGILLFALLAGNAHAQATASTIPEDAFAKGRWRAEFFAQAALEAWNYNPSHEELYGLVQGVTYGLRDGLVLMARQRLYYISQRRNDSRLLGLTTGLRARVYRRGRTSAFLQFDVGVSDAAVALPPGGTRFNYLAIGGAGVTMRISPRLQAVAALEVIHVSNAGVAGHDRNPDIEAIGPSLGLSIGF